MKSIALATALVAFSAVGSFAQQAPVALPSSIASQVMAVLPGVDLSSLTNAQYAELVTFFGNNENTRTAADVSQGVKVILNAQ